MLFKSSPRKIASFMVIKMKYHNVRVKVKVKVRVKVWTIVRFSVILSCGVSYVPRMA